MKKFFNIIWKIVKFLLNILKHIFLLPLYCSMPDKYSGVSYNEWLSGQDNKDDDVIEKE